MVFVFTLENMMQDVKLTLVELLCKPYLLVLHVIGFKPQLLEMLLTMEK